MAWDPDIERIGLGMPPAAAGSPAGAHDRQATAKAYEGWACAFPGDDEILIRFEVKGRADG